MQYRQDIKSGNKLSVLGFGCMRLPRNLTQIDVKKTEKLILSAVQNGINYYDTAYIYPGSEEVLGQIIAKNNIRDKIFLATKLPIGKCQKHEDFDAFFHEQLERLNTDYIDYYLMHGISNANRWKYLCSLGIEEWIAEKKASGQIRQIGFSFHGSQNEFMILLDEYSWDFCQIQYNYININYQAGMAGLKTASSKGLPVFIMEPLLGGKLANGLPKKAVKIFQNANASISPATWAFNWLWDQQEITVVLSGMNEESQLNENIGIANIATPNMLSQVERDTVKSVVEIFSSLHKIQCTGCNYCMPCPRKVNIPGCFDAYNTSYVEGMPLGIKQYISSTSATDPKANYSASKCKKCGICEKKCPQYIPIIKSLEQVAKRMEPFWYKWFINIISKLLNKRKR